MFYAMFGDWLNIFLIVRMNQRNEISFSIAVKRDILTNPRIQPFKNKIPFHLE